MMKRGLLALCLITQMICWGVAQQTSPVGPPPAPTQRTTQQRPQRPDAEDVVKITTNLVQVDAVVTDKDGKAVTDLKPEEVQILEDGKPQKITHFAYNVTGIERASPAEKSPAPSKSIGVSPPAAPKRLTRENVHRTIAIVVDDLGLSFDSIRLVRRALKKFVDEQMQPGDLVAIIRTAGGAGALQQFTSDKRQLYAAIERVKYNLMGRADTSAFSAIRPPDLKIPDEQESRNQTPENFREEVFSVGTLGTLRYVVSGLGEMPGRKSVLLLSDGLKIFNPGDPNGTNRVQAALESLSEFANRASVVIYTMDARGLPTFGLQAQDNVQLAAPVGRPGIGGPLGATRSIREVNQMMSIRRSSFYESQNGLNYLAQQTGGLAIRNRNDLSGGVQRVLEDQRGYYLIGYRPEESTFDEKSGRRKFHRLSLRVTRPGKFNVRMRNGFFGVSDEEIKPAEKTAAQLLLKAITSPFASSGVHLQLTSLFANDAANGSFMRSFMHIDVRDLTFKQGPNGTHECVFDVLAMTFGDNGVPVDYTAQTYMLQLPEAEYQRAMQQGLVYSVTVPMKKPGVYQFRMALRDTDTNRIGSVNQLIEVPDLAKNRLALSGVVLNGKAITGGGGPPNAVAVDGNRPSANDPEASPAVRRFKQMMRLEYGLLVYNAALDKASGKPQLTTQIRLFREGKQIFSGDALPFNSTGQTDMGRLVVSGALDLGTDLTPGEYIFQIIVTDGIADKKYRVVSQWMDFEIVK
jgi:VWFA-related protein